MVIGLIGNKPEINKDGNMEPIAISTASRSSLANADINKP
jgi:hypothetical protein